MASVNPLDMTWEQFAAVNRVPVWPGKWNRWQLLTNQVPEDSSPEDVARAIISIMSVWCGGLVSGSKLDPWLTWTGTRPTGAASDLMLREYGVWADVPDLAVGGGLPMTQRQRDEGATLDRMRAPGPVQVLDLSDNPAVKVQIAFVWRSSAETLPWPVWREGLTGNLDPLVRKSWVLDRVLDATNGAPDESTLLDSLLMPAAEEVMQNTNQVSNAASDAAQAAKQVAQWGFGGALLILGAGAALWLAASLPRRR